MEMKQLVYLYSVFCICGLGFQACSAQESTSENGGSILSTAEDRAIRTGAEVLMDDWSVIQDVHVGLLVNQTSRVGDQHLVDLLLEKGISIGKTDKD